MGAFGVRVPRGWLERTQSHTRGPAETTAPDPKQHTTQHNNPAPPPTTNQPQRHPQQLPERPWTGEAHCALLRRMQQLVELRESARVVLDISTVSGGGRVI